MADRGFLNLEGAKHFFKKYNYKIESIGSGEYHVYPVVVIGCPLLSTIKKPGFIIKESLNRVDVYPTNEDFEPFVDLHKEICGNLPDKNQVRKILSELVTQRYFSELRIDGALLSAGKYVRIGPDGEQEETDMPNIYSEGCEEARKKNRQSEDKMRERIEKSGNFSKYEIEAAEHLFGKMELTVDPKYIKWLYMMARRPELCPSL
jgi:hypothetical protein